MAQNENGHSSGLKNPEEIAKQLREALRKRPALLSSQETIESYKNEILQLKIRIYQLKQMSSKDVANLDLDEIKQDVVDDLTAKNENLTKQVEELTRKLESKNRKEEKRKLANQQDAYCQTNLDSLNIDKLIKASITLKRQQEQQRQQNKELYMKTPIAPRNKSSQQTFLDQHQSSHQIMSQLQYPHVTLHNSQPKQSTSGANGNLNLDERKILEDLYRTNGILTTARDILRAKAEIGS